EPDHTIAGAAEILLPEVWSRCSRKSYVVSGSGISSDSCDRVQIIISVTRLNLAAQIKIQQAGIVAGASIGRAGGSPCRRSKAGQRIGKRAACAKIGGGESMLCADNCSYVGSSRGLVGSLLRLHQVGNSYRSDDQDDRHHDQQLDERKPPLSP